MSCIKPAVFASGKPVFLVNCLTVKNVFPETLIVSKASSLAPDVIDSTLHFIKCKAAEPLGISMPSGLIAIWKGFGLSPFWRENVAAVVFVLYLPPSKTTKSGKSVLAHSKLNTPLMVFANESITTPSPVKSVLLSSGLLEKFLMPGISTAVPTV